MKASMEKLKAAEPSPCFMLLLRATIEKKWKLSMPSCVPLESQGVREKGLLPLSLCNALSSAFCLSHGYLEKFFRRLLFLLILSLSLFSICGCAVAEAGEAGGYDAHCGDSGGWNRSYLSSFDSMGDIELIQRAFIISVASPSAFLYLPEASGADIPRGVVVV